MSKTRDARTLEEMLQDTSDVLCPADMGNKPIRLNTQGIDGDTPLHVYLWRGDDWAARKLIEAGADINAVGDMGYTPLHVALSKGNISIIEILLVSGAKTDIRSEFGETSSDIADRLGGEIKRLMKKYA